MNNEPWQAIFSAYNIDKHDFNVAPFEITAKQIKSVTSHFSRTSEREVRILCKQDSREDRPAVFVQKGLFLLPIKNGVFAIVKGEGYVDLSPINTASKIYSSKLDFIVDTAKFGDSEMQHLDFAYASSLIRTFMQDESLILAIRGRKYTPEFSFCVGKHNIDTRSVQTEVDAGYEGRNQVVLVEAKNNNTANAIIRQLYYPFRQWQIRTQKQVKTLFFEKRENSYFLWQFEFSDIHDYNSIRLIKSQRFEIV